MIKVILYLVVTINVWGIPVAASECLAFLDDQSQEIKLLLAIRALDVSAVSIHLDDGASPNKAFVDSYSPLQETLKQLTSRPIKSEITPFHIGLKQIAELLIAHGADINEQVSPSHIVSTKRSGFSQYKEPLLSNIIQMDHYYFRDRKLDSAAELARAYAAKILIDAKVSLNSTDYNGRTALHMSALDNTTIIAELLITSGINRQIRSLKNQTAQESIKHDGSRQAVLSVLTKM